MILAYRIINSELNLVKKLHFILKKKVKEGRNHKWIGVVGHSAITEALLPPGDGKP